MKQQQSLIPLYHTLTRNPSRRFARNYIQPRMNDCRTTSFNQNNEARASRTNVETNKRQQFYSELERIKIEEAIESMVMECCVCIVELSVGSKEIRSSCSHG
jgi:hypothetical protein